MTDATNVLEQRNVLHRYQHLVEITRDLASTLNLDALLNRIVNIAVELSCCEAASILLYDQKSDRLFFQTCSNIDKLPLMQGMHVPGNGSLAGWVIAHRQVVVVPDVRRDGRHYEQIDQSLKFSTSSLMGLPMVTKDKIIGVLEVVNKLAGEFTQDDQDVLTVLSAQAAVAIENTRLFQQSDYISELVHELRTPISSLCAVSHLLERNDLTDDQRVEYARTIYSESMRLNEMASSFLDLARLESGRAEFNYTRFDLSPLIQECNEVVSKEAENLRIAIHLDIKNNLPMLDADREKIKRVLLNLLNNAIKYNRPDGSIVLRAYAAKKEMVIEIKDNGIGIPTEAIPHLFEKFYRVKSVEKTTGGTGLGLSICKQIIESHRGRIEVSSQVDKGTVFKVFVPLVYI